MECKVFFIFVEQNSYKLKNYLKMENTVLFKEKEIYTDLENGDTVEIMCVTINNITEIDGAWIKFNNENEEWWNDSKIDQFILNYC